jgi:hypothetical protein
MSMSKFGGQGMTTTNNSAVNVNGDNNLAGKKSAALFDEDFERDYQSYNYQQIKNQENASG